jgi:hypothetical protein
MATLEPFWPRWVIKRGGRIEFERRDLIDLQAATNRRDIALTERRNRKEDIREWAEKYGHRAKLDIYIWDDRAL